MQVTVADFSKNNVVFNISGCTREELDNKLNLFFSAEGYKLKSSAAEKHVYEKGNRVARILLGAFVKYHKQSVVIKNDGAGFAVLMHKDSSGMSGGLIGVNQVNKEFSRLTEKIKTFLS